MAAVARITIASRTAGAEIATTIEAFGESVGAPQPAAGPPGTRVIVRDLFANVPVRREYLRSPAAEFSRISTWLSTLALAYPNVAFALEHDGRGVFAFAPQDDMQLRLQHVFGARAGTILRIAGARDDERVGIAGWISSPGDDRPDRRAQVLFVNGRLLRSTLLSGAWSAAYRTFAMSGRHPYGVVYLTVPPEEVDPNVHPTKTDVRLRRGDRVVSVVKEALATSLRRGAIERLERSISYAPPLRAVNPGPGAAGWSEMLTLDQPPAPRGMRVLAQVDRTFILATDGEAVVLIDQHAAHERIVYEQLAANAAKRAPAEPLLVPHTFEVRPEEAETLDASLDALRDSGLSIEHFGERAYRITAVPARMIHAGKTRTFDLAAFLEGLADDARGLGYRERVWASLACHSVARAGDRLELPEMAALLARLEACENPMHCPHGRPTVVRLEPEQIARLFKRQ
ncbi:MAG: DNA mismatch repair endonuclease MutL [Candidatus Velthaea sp.]